MALNEPRIRRLAKHLGISRFEALGRILPVWMLCYHRRSATIDATDIDVTAELDGFADGMVIASLADRKNQNGEIRIRGVAERIEFLERQSEKGRKSGESRRSNIGSNKRSTNNEQMLNKGSRGGSTYSPDLDQAHALDQAPDPDIENERITDLVREGESLDRNARQDVSVVQTVRHGAVESREARSQSADEQRTAKSQRTQDNSNGALVEPIAVRLPDPPIEALQLGLQLLEYVTRNHPDSKLARAPERTREHTALMWGDEIRRMHSIDSLPYAAIAAMVHWCQRDPFWKGVVLNASTLRKNWDKIRAQRSRAHADKIDPEKRRADIDRDRKEQRAREAAAMDRSEARAALRDAGLVKDPIPSDNDTEENDPEIVQGSIG